jgi:hypothetical protein
VKRLKARQVTIVDLTSQVNKRKGGTRQEARPGAAGQGRRPHLHAPRLLAAVRRRLHERLLELALSD